MSYVQRIALLMTQDTGFNRQALLGVRAFATARKEWLMHNRQIRKWLRDLPKPVAVLAANDVPGRDLSAMCHHLGLRIPDDVAVLGVDDDELECQLAFPPLSSVSIPAERIGYEAARILDRMLAGRPVSREPLFLPPLRVVARQSTSALAVVFRRLEGLTANAFRRQSQLQEHE